MSARTIRAILRDYIVQQDLAETTEKYYGRVVSVLCTWTGCDVAESEFTPELCSEFLLAKQRAGRSSYYRKSLRSGLRSLLNFVGKTGRLRRVRLDTLDPFVWSANEVGCLVSSVYQVIGRRELPIVRQERQWYWASLILVAYYTGLSQVDLHRLSTCDVMSNGVIVFSRSRTKKRVVVGVPLQFASELLVRPPGLLWPKRTSDEFFRREFARIVKAAGLVGTFKKLRKTCGTDVEVRHPGRGHEYLGNTRSVFERHYLAVRSLPLRPLTPHELPRPQLPPDVA